MRPPTTTRQHATYAEGGQLAGASTAPTTTEAVTSATVRGGSDCAMYFIITINVLLIFLIIAIFLML